MNRNATTTTQAITGWGNKALLKVPAEVFWNVALDMPSTVEYALRAAGASTVEYGGFGDAGDLGYIFRVTGRTGLQARMIINEWCGVVSVHSVSGDFNEAPPF